MTRLLFFVLFLFASLTSLAQKPQTLWYNQPARNWNEALPVGNGRLGVMVFGRVTDELLQLNEETLWSGGPVNRNPNPGAVDYLPQVRDALFREDYAQAAKLTQKIQGLYSEAYQPLGDLLLKQTVTGTTSAYYRDVNISNATATTRFAVDGVTYTRELFVSAPDQVIVIRLTASKQGSLTVTAATRSPHPATIAVLAVMNWRCGAVHRCIPTPIMSATTKFR